MAIIDPFSHLESRCLALVSRYVDPIIRAETHATVNGDPLPEPDFDSLAAFRLLSHAELEGYFEAKAEQAIAALDADFKAGNFMTAQFAALVFLNLWKKKKDPQWNHSGADKDEIGEFKRLAQESLGYARQFIKENNGVKENSISTLSALMGYFASELDQILVSELNQYGKNRGDVAHDSWLRNTRTFEAADIEKSRILNILKLTKQFYETTPKISPIFALTTPKSGFFVRIFQFFVNLTRVRIGV